MIMNETLIHNCMPQSKKPSAQSMAVEENCLESPKPKRGLESFIHLCFGIHILYWLSKKIKTI